MANEKVPTLGVVLAGGLARRMGGGDKSMRRIDRLTILDRVLERLGPQCVGLLLNANGDPARFARFRPPVVADSVENHPGPLAGVLAGLDWTAANRPGVEWIVSVAADCPFLPRDLVERLHRARMAKDADLAVATSARRRHPVIGLWQVAMRDELRHALVEEGIRKIDHWTARYRVATASWPARPVDPFFNVNTPKDLAEAERLVWRLADF
jgi:molybdopterin-guanine dinucleotide biosynthesis protein A